MNGDIKGNGSMKPTNGPRLRSSSQHGRAAASSTTPLRHSFHPQAERRELGEFSLTTVYADLNAQLHRSRTHLELAISRKKVLEFQLQQTQEELEMMLEQKAERDQTLALLHKSLKISFNDVPARTEKAAEEALESSLEKFKDKLRTYLGRLNGS